MSVSGALPARQVSLSGPSFDVQREPRIRARVPANQERRLLMNSCPPAAEPPCSGFTAQRWNARGVWIMQTGG
jgi:hypothetical protein